MASIAITDEDGLALTMRLDVNILSGLHRTETPKESVLVILFDENRYLNKDYKTELVAGDAVDTIPSYVKKNTHLVISLLFLDFDLYQPTKIALEYFLPRMPKGGMIVFDEVNNRFWPGETVALLEQFKSLNNLQIQKFSFDHNISYVTI